MAIIKCKMCGGDLEIAAGVTVAECEYCGTKQTLPKANDEVVQNLFNRANNLRIKCEFDKAEQIYEKILQENDAESEAHWGIVLCKYGIEYVEDPKTFKRIPTCHRTSYDAVTTDPDYLAAIENADAVQRGIYEAEAKVIDAIQKDTLNIVKNEKPFDVFICYKETDENGKRTVDSTIANDIYYQLTQEGLKVFYAAITLEDKLGQEYEPYIFAALNSAKVMLVIGTKPQYFSAVWVKNEWSRFLKLMKVDRSKLLIPCYKDMDAYDLPEEFAHLQAQDMSKIGFINDLVRGIKKVVTKDDKATSVKETVVVNGGGTSAAPLLKRAVMFLEDGDWAKADDFCEQVLNIDPENAQAYVGKLMAELKVHRQADLVNCADPFDNRNSYKKAVRFASPELRDELEGYVESIKDRNETNRLNGIYNDAEKKYAAANTEAEYKEVAEIFQSISNWKDASKRAANTLAKAEEARKNKIYDEAVRDSKSTEPDVIMSAVPRLESIAGWKDATEIALTCPGLAEEARKQLIYNSSIQKAKMNTIDSYKEAIGIMQEIKGWKDVNSKISEYEACIRDLIEKAEADRRAEAQREKERKAVAAKKKRNIIIASIAAAVCVTVIIVVTTVIIPSSKYSKADKLLSQGSYLEAVEIFKEIPTFKDSQDKIVASAVGLINEGDFDSGIAILEEMDGYGNSEEKINEAKYTIAESLEENGEYASAAMAFGKLGILGYSDSADRSMKLWNKVARRHVISCGGGETLLLMADGTVKQLGYDYDGAEKDTIPQINALKDIISVSVTSYFDFVAVTSDGKAIDRHREEATNVVVACGDDFDNAYLLIDGTVQCTDDDINVSDWENIVDICMSKNHLVGLKADGTVVSSGTKYADEGQCNVSGWTDIVQIACGEDYTLGLKSDGTVVYAGSSYGGINEVTKWADIVSISCDSYAAVGLKKDGTVVGTGASFDEYDPSDNLNVSNWKDIIYVEAGSWHIIGMKSDGTLISTYQHSRADAANVSGIKGVMMPE